MSDNAIESLLEDDRKDAIRAVLQVLEGDIDEFPPGYGNHLERLSESFEQWNVELREASDSTEVDMEEYTERSDSVKNAKENLLTKKADAQRRKLEAEQDIAAAEKDLEENAKILEMIERDGATLKEGRAAVRETHLVAGRALQMLQGIVKQLRESTSTNEDLKRKLFQDESQKGNAQLQMLRAIMKRKRSGTETPRNMGTPRQSEDEGRSQSQGKRATGSDKPNEPENPPKTPKPAQAKAKVAPDVIKEQHIQQEKRDKRRELENVPDKWKLKQRDERDTGFHCFHCGSDSHKAFECR